MSSGSPSNDSGLSDSGQLVERCCKVQAAPIALAAFKTCARAPHGAVAAVVAVLDPEMVVPGGDSGHNLDLKDVVLFSVIATAPGGSPAISFFSSTPGRAYLHERLICRVEGEVTIPSVYS